MDILSVERVGNMRFSLQFFTVATCAFVTLLCSLVTVHAQQKDRFYFERKGYAHWQVPTHERVVALTFDDGPDPTYTPEVLQLLAEYGEHGTFFLIGHKVKTYPEVVKQTVLLGNELGNHTYSHRHLATLTPAQFEEELNKTSTEIEHITGHIPSLFRPPRGFYNESTVLTAHNSGYPVIMWSWDEDTRDWQLPGVDKIVQTVLSNLHPGDIILFHDGTGNSKQTIAALRIILPRLQQQGYRSVTVSELLKMADHQGDD
jgi:peptidoglycan-N-acetylglucosamine deacetylase